MNSRKPTRLTVKVAIRGGGGSGEVSGNGHSRLYGAKRVTLKTDIRAGGYGEMEGNGHSRL